MQWCDLFIRNQGRINRMPYLRVMAFLSRFLLFTFLFFSTNLYCQDISGEWIGEIYMKDKKGEYLIYFPVYFEIKYDSITKKISGANSTKSFDTVLSDCSIDGGYNGQTKIYILNEIATIYSNLKPLNKKDSIEKGVLNRFIVKHESTPEEQLRGTCECKNPHDHPLCLKDLKIVLRRYKPDKKERL